MKTIIRDLFLDIISKDEFRQKWKRIKQPNSRVQAKLQERLICDFSIFWQDEDYSTLKDLEDGDFRLGDNVYIDLKVGKRHCGAISFKSALHFAPKKNHYYICTNSDLTKFYVIEGQEFLNHIKPQEYFGENFFREIYGEPIRC